MAFSWEVCDEASYSLSLHFLRETQIPSLVPLVSLRAELGRRSVSFWIYLGTFQVAERSVYFIIRNNFYKGRAISANCLFGFKGGKCL